MREGEVPETGVPETEVSETGTLEHAASERLRIEVAPGIHLAGELTLPSSRDDASADLAAIYLHGFGSSRLGEKADRFRRHMVARRVTFAAFDFRGHGESGGSMRDLSLTRNLEDVACVRKELARRGYRRFVVLGSSMGGLTGLWHCAREPEGIVAAAHLAPALGLEDAFRRRLGAGAVERWEAEGSCEIEHDLGSWSIDWGFVEDLRRYPVDELIEQHRVPALLFQGRHDDSVPWESVVDFATRCRDDRIELHLFADGDHRMLDRLERLATLLDEFLDARLGPSS